MNDYLLYRLKYRYAPYLHLKRPVDIALELSSRCNIKCQYCYHEDKPPFDCDDMNINTAYSIIDSASLIGVNSLKFNWRGESTLNPEFGKILNYAKNKNTFVELLLNTNFMFNKSRDDIFKGLCALDKVKISLDSLSQSVLDKQRKGAKVKIILDNLDKFYDWPKRKTKIIIQSIRTNLNKSERIDIKLKKKYPALKFSIRDMVTGRNDKQLEDLEHKKKQGKRKPCLQAFSRIIFNYKGEAFPCCPDITNILNIGNIQNQSVYEIFNSNEAISIRNTLKNKCIFDKMPCNACTSYESYVGYKHPFSS